MKVCPICNEASHLCMCPEDCKEDAIEENHHYMVKEINRLNRLVDKLKAKITKLENQRKVELLNRGPG